MLNLVKDAAFLKELHGQPGKNHVGIINDVKTANEAIATPHIRVAPLQKPQYNKLLTGTLKARDPVGGGLKVGDIVFLLDGGKHGAPPCFPSGLAHVETVNAGLGLDDECVLRTAACSFQNLAR